MTPGRLFRCDKAFVAMIHVGALPASPHARLSVDALGEQAVAEANLLVSHGADALLLENMHDRPYLNRTVGPEVVAAMSAVAAAVRVAVPRDVACGIQILAGANRAALAVAHIAGLQFIRAEGFVFAHVADEGLMDCADAGPLLRERRRLGADAVRVLADVKKKHSAHALTADVDLAETARAAEFFGADAVVITGSATGRPARPDDVRQARAAVRVPVLVGSGVTADNLREYWPAADAFIIGSALKRDGQWFNEPDPSRLAAVFSAFHALRTS